MDEEIIWLPMTCRKKAVAGANVENIAKTTMFHWHLNANHDFHMIHLCNDYESKYW